MKITQVLFSSKKSGGNIYEQSLSFLEKYFDYNAIILLQDNTMNRFEKLFMLIKNILDYTFNQYPISDISIRNLTAVFMLKKKKKNIVIFHHYDPLGYPSSTKIFQKFLFLNFLSNKSKIDKVVVVSEYWKQYLVEQGFKSNQIDIIYNSFDLNNYKAKSEEALQNFRYKYNLLNKKIVYIGNAQKIKGTDISYNILKDLDIYIVTSGIGTLDIPCLNLNLNFDEYVTLLQVSSLVVLMSQFNEGWNRVAHEALLCKTPVIGSGRGGMKELLLESGQIICSDSKTLGKSVQVVLEDDENAKLQVETGYKYAKKMDCHYFENAWVNLVKSL